MGPLPELRARRFAHMKGAAVLAPEGCRDALLAFEDASQAGPACALPLLAEAPADEHGVLADPVSAALVAHEAVRVIDVAAFGCAYLGAPDEHGGG